MSARPNLPHTSLESYRASEPVRVSHRNMIASALDFFSSGLTAEEVSVALGFALDSVQVNREMSEMEKLGIAERNQIGTNNKGKPIFECRTNKNGRRMAVWFKCSDKFAHG